MIKLRPQIHCTIGGVHSCPKLNNREDSSVYRNWGMMSWRKSLFRGSLLIGITLILMALAIVMIALCRADAPFLGVGLSSPDQVSGVHSYAKVPFHLDLPGGRYVALAFGRESFTNDARASLWNTDFVINLTARAYEPNHIVWFPAQSDMVIPAWSLLAAGILLSGPSVVAAALRRRHSRKRGFMVGFTDKTGD